MELEAGRDWSVDPASTPAWPLPSEDPQAHTRRFYAAMLLRRDCPGDADQARSLLAEADALYQAMAIEEAGELQA